MANMSASILRNIVSSVLKVDSRNIQLSGEISTDMKCPNWSGNQWDSRYKYTQIWGFSPDKGLIELPVKGEEPSFGYIASKFPEEYKECIFFVVKKWGCTQMQCPEDYDYYEDYIIFKAPNFQQYFASIEEAEIVRWEQWIKE